MWIKGVQGKRKKYNRKNSSGEQICYQNIEKDLHSAETIKYLDIKAVCWLEKML